MKYIITESQYKLLKEQSFEGDNLSSNEISNSYKDNKHYQWFDYLDPKFIVPKIDMEAALKNTIDLYINQLKYNIKRIVAKNDNGDIIGFLIFTDKGTNIDNFGDGKEYPVILSTAVNPDYRNKGILKNMIDKSKVPKPYLVHTSPLSPPGVWEKFGCRKVKEIGRFNYVEKCD
jgi:hypothetical protein